MKVISRDEAISQGLKKYFTGKPCKNGHICERHVIGRNCVLCKRQQDVYYAKKRSSVRGNIIPPFDGKTITRKQAIDKGFKYYFTRKECKNGHIAFRDVINSNCVHCMVNYERSIEQKERHRAKSVEWANKNKERVREIKRNWVKNNPKKMKDIRKRSNAKRNEMRRKLWGERDPFYISMVAFRGMAKRVLKYSGRKKGIKDMRYDELHHS